MCRMRSPFLLVSIVVVTIIAIYLSIFILEANSLATADIYLVSGYPTRYEEAAADMIIRIYRVSRETKKITDSIELLPPSESTAFIRAYHDERLLILAHPYFSPKQLVIVNMDDPCQPRHLDIDCCAFQPLRSYLLNIPNEGLYLALTGFSRASKYHLLQFINLRNGQTEPLDVNVLKFARLPGLSGLGHEDKYFMDLLVDLKGFPRKPWSDDTGKRLIDFGWSALPERYRPMKKLEGRWPVNGVEQVMGDATWVVGTEEFDLVYPREDDGVAKTLIFQLFEKSKRSWHEILVPGDYPQGLAQLKPFGSWLAGVPTGEAIRTESKRRELIERLHKEGRGGDERYLRLLLANPQPELFLYNTRTEKGYTIRTGDIESEVLLIENDTVYYRVHDRLYRSSIRQGQVKTPDLLVQDPALIDVYWAFSGPSCKEAKKPE